MKKIKIKTEYIKLDQFLKFTGVVSNGGEAKILINDGLAKVNGETELRRGRKLRLNDVVEFGGNEFVIV
ncbi:MAG: RNA-binding S4 domain-containing protein [Clostridiales bacterium]|nr:RNA-binding S4 domain-containing protein [Clostridiales bacterium]